METRTNWTLTIVAGAVRPGLDRQRPRTVTAYAASQQRTTRHGNRRCCRTPFVLLAGLAIAGLLPGAQAASPLNGFTITDLSNSNARAVAISPNGIVVGTYYSNGNAYEAFIWRPNTPNGTTGTLENLDPSGKNFGWQQFYPEGVNNHGHVAAYGYSNTPGGPVFFPYVWQGGRLTQLWTPTVPGGCQSYTGCRNPSFEHGEALAINQSGVAVGAFNGQNSVYWPTPVAYTPLDPAPPHKASGNSVAYAINDHNHITGFSTFDNTLGRGQMFLFDGVAVRGPFALPGSDNSTGRAINNLDQVVGDSGRYASYAHAFFFDQRVMHDIHNANAFGGSTAYGVNNLGQVVGAGIYFAYATGAFYWDKDQGMIDLNKLLPKNSGWRILLAAYAINDAGQIVGVGYTMGGSLSAFLLMPTPPAPAR